MRASLLSARAVPRKAGTLRTGFSRFGFFDWRDVGASGSCGFVGLLAWSAEGGYVARVRDLILQLLFVAGAGAAQLSAPTVYSGMCDASAAVAISSNLFVVADDEDNKLRIYDANGGGAPVKAFDFSSFLRIDPKEPELDVEGAARIGNRIYWITGHGRNKNAKYRESRQRFFATDILETANGPELKAVGKYYARLLVDLLTDPRFSSFGLAYGSQRAPKDRGGFNIEGLTETPDGKLLIGFRNPIPKKRALLVPLLNPGQVVEGGAMKLGNPIQLDLQGRGVRAITLQAGEYIIIAGAYDTAARAQLYRWDGRSPAPTLVRMNWGSINPEAVVFYSGRREAQVLSDDGTLKIARVPCKELKDPMQRRFRAVRVTF